MLWPPPRLRKRRGRDRSARFMLLILASAASVAGAEDTTSTYQTSSVFPTYFISTTTLPPLTTSTGAPPANPTTSHAASGTTKSDDDGTYPDRMPGAAEEGSGDSFEGKASTVDGRLNQDASTSVASPEPLPTTRPQCRGSGECRCRHGSTPVLQLQPSGACRCACIKPASTTSSSSPFSITTYPPLSTHPRDTTTPAATVSAIGATTARLLHGSTTVPAGGRNPALSCSSIYTQDNCKQSVRCKRKQK